jgi:MFS family permease
MFASVGSILYGYDLGVIAEAIHSDNFVMQFNPTASQSGAVVSVFTGGAFFGAMFAGPAGDYLGRKKTIMLGALIFIVGGSLQTAAQSLDYLYAGRAIAGLGVGFLVMIIPLYQAELAHPSIRGAVTALQQFMLGIGALVATWASYGCYINFPATSDKQWRISLGVQIVPAVILAALIMFFPESPRSVTIAHVIQSSTDPSRWLIDHGKHEQGLRTLAKLHAHGNEGDAWVVAEYDQIRETIAYEHENEAKSYLDLFRNKSSFRRLLLACAIQASVQMTGVSAIQ